MKKIAFVSFAIVFALSVQAFAEGKPLATETTITTTTKSTTVPNTAPATVKTVTTETKAVATEDDSLLVGSITKLTAGNMSLKDSTGKEWSFKTSGVNLANYKVGDNVKITFEKEDLRSIRFFETAR